MAEPPEESLRCVDCKSSRVFPSTEAAALHRRTVHGVALPPEIRRAIEERDGPKMPSLAPRAERVPSHAIGLPWIRYPRESRECNAIVEQFDGGLTGATSDAQRLFWDLLRNVVATIANRTQAV